MMILLSLIALVVVVIAATVVITRYSDNIFAAFTKWTDSSPQVPDLIPFQAVLTDSIGVLVDDGNYPVTFAFYSSATGGTPRWSEIQVVTTAAGTRASSEPSPSVITKLTNIWDAPSTSGWGLAALVAGIAGDGGRSPGADLRQQWNH